MSSSITIPHRQTSSFSTTSSLSSSSLFSSSSSSSPSTGSSSPSTSLQGELTGKGREKRVSLLSSSLLAQEHTVINIGHPESPRLITCVRSSQGFDWNQEIFLPSHHDHLIPSDLERKKDPVHEIVLSEEEIAEMFPH